MATTWAEICAAAMVLIDDERLKEQLAISPALYYRGMSLYVATAMPKLCRPPELLDYLTNGMTEPEYGDFEWVSTEASTETETAVDTGMTGYDICSCVIVEVLDDGRILQTPYAISYNSETGIVTFPIQNVSDVVYQLDFYKDGSFNDLTASQIQLFAFAIAVVWDERFINTWLDRAPKINDSSFSTVNEANWTEKTSQAHRRMEQDFNDALKHYEQRCAYQSVVSSGLKGMVRLV